MSKEEPLAVGIAGDWHYNIPHALAVVDQFHGLGLKHIFQLGDFGLWGGLLKHSHDKLRWRLEKKLEKFDMLLFITLGNHENYKLLESFSVVNAGPWAGFLFEPEAPHILYFQRGQSIQLRGRNFLSLGGAASIDYKFREIGKSMWTEERITVKNIWDTLEEFERIGSVDVFLAHDVFASAPIFGTHRQSDKWDSEEKAYAQTSRDALEKVVTKVYPTLWLHGHYHQPIETSVDFSTAEGIKTVKTYCLAMDQEKKSTGILWLDELEFEYLPNYR